MRPRYGRLSAMHRGVRVSVVSQLMKIDMNVVLPFQEIDA